MKIQFLTDFFADLLTRAFRAMPALPDPRDETPEAAAKRLHHLERSAAAVLQKINRVYALENTLTDARQLKCEIIADHVASAWFKAAPEQPNLGGPREDSHKIRTCVSQNALNYLQALYVFRDLKKDPAINTDGNRDYTPYKKQKVRENLYRIYANHLTNAAEARLIANGVDAVTAHRINGFTIGRTLEMARSEIDAEVEVAPGRQYASDDRHAIQNIEKIRHYWRLRAKELSHEINNPDHYRGY